MDGRRDSGSVADKTWTTMASVQSAWNGIYGLSRGIVGEIYEGKRGRRSSRKGGNETCITRSFEFQRGGVRELKVRFVPPPSTLDTICLTARRIYSAEYISYIPCTVTVTVHGDVHFYFPFCTFEYEIIIIMIMERKWKHHLSKRDLFKRIYVPSSLKEIFPLMTAR